jgi:hypothetical protein
MIFCFGVKSILEDGKHVEADAGYKAEDPDKIVAAGKQTRFMEDQYWVAKRGKVRR